MGYRILEISKSVVNNGDGLGLVVGMLLILCGLLGILSIIDKGFA